jgi:glycosyltransferase involved in cell wall biosynthesis
VEVVLNGIDILTVPSTSGEGFPNIIAEAMATETPVIATNIGATSDILDETGLIIDPLSEEQLADGLSKLISNSDSRKLLGISGRKKIQEMYTINQMVQQTQNVLQL